MKRFWLVLLSLALITAFSTAAMAVDVKVSGEYYAGGLYLDKTTLQKNYGTNTAFFYQRLRTTTQFVVSPGLTLNVRFDVMERAWGATRSAASTVQDTLSAGSRAENENIAFDLLYVSYISPIGIFNAGYQIDGAWGTVFGDSSNPTPKLVYNFVMGGFVAGLQMGVYNNGENNYTAINTTADGSDKDNSFYTGFVKYSWKTGQAGLLFKWNEYRYARGAGTVTVPIPFSRSYLATLPYAKVKLGPVDLQAEIIWLYGKYYKFEPAGYTDVDWNGLAAWVDAKADFGMAYVGGTFAYMSGDDPSSTDKVEASGGGGLDWNPCLILFNSDLGYWVGSQPGYSGSANGSGMSNAWFFQLKGGVKPVDKLDIGLSASYANAVVKPTVSWLYNDYGWEVDLTATYKITNNLSYMLGGGYLFTGKYFKGATESEIQDNYLVLNKLTLTF